MDTCMRLMDQAVELLHEAIENEDEEVVSMIANSTEGFILRN